MGHRVGGDGPPLDDTDLTFPHFAPPVRSLAPSAGNDRTGGLPLGAWSSPAKVSQ